MKNEIARICVLGLGLVSAAAEPPDKPVETVEHFGKITAVTHVVVYHEKGQFAAWPANSGLWSWDSGRELLVGFTKGPYVEQSGHKISDPRNALARSLDGGATWLPVHPVGYADDDRLTPAAPSGRINFEARGFALRVNGMGYHGDRHNVPTFYYSYDRGETWSGPVLFGGLDRMKELEGMTDITPRTDYQVLGKHACLLLFSATDGPFLDKTFAIKTTDGGLSFTFVSWVVPPSDPYRAVMPQTAFVGRKELVTLLRRRDKPRKPTECWIDAYRSTDEGRSWSFWSRVAYTGQGSSNGNPPALTTLKDGRLLAVYGNRSLRMMLCRLSDDTGKTWGEEIIIRDDFLHKEHDFADFGYPRVTQRGDGKILAFYYFADEARYEQHIVCSIFTLDSLEEVEVRRSVVAPQAPAL